MSALATTFHECFADNLREHPTAPFIIDPHQVFTYADVAVEVDRVANWLVGAGVRRGDRVVIQLRKSLREVAAMIAASKIGAVFVNANIALTPGQLEFIVADCDARAMILECRVATAMTSGGRKILISNEHWNRLASEETVAPSLLDSELAAIIYTSGSTGMPKGVMLSHRNILAGTRSVARYLRLHGDDRLLSVLPYSFDYGLNQLTTMMLVGGSIVHQPVTLPVEIVRAMQIHNVTGVAAVPPLWTQIVRLLEAAPREFPSLRLITNSGGKIPDPILERMPAIFPQASLYLMYGLTEAFRSTYLPPEKFLAKTGSIGRAIPGAEVHVIKHGIGIAGLGEQGELVHRGPLVSLGYWNNPDATANKIKPCPELAELIGNEPVVYSGDIVRIDADGDLWFVSRRDALIKSSGFRISPEEIEDIVHRSGLVGEVVAFGRPDNLLGQSVHMAATLLPGADLDRLFEYCRCNMPAYMVPRAIHLWEDAMPRTTSGKLARPDVIKRCESKIEQQQIN